MYNLRTYVQYTYSSLLGAAPPIRDIYVRFHESSDYTVEPWNTDLWNLKPLEQRTKNNGSLPFRYKNMTPESIRRYVGGSFGTSTVPVDETERGL